jgi:hypothetical protein
MDQLGVGDERDVLEWMEAVSRIGFAFPPVASADVDQHVEHREHLCRRMRSARRGEPRDHLRVRLGRVLVRDDVVRVHPCMVGATAPSVNGVPRLASTA